MVARKFVLKFGMKHVVLGTGYRIDVRQYPFLSSEVLERMDIVDGYPRLADGFETSLPRLHIVGAPAAWSFGPLMKFVAGTEFASPALRSRVLQAKLRSVVSQTLSEVPLERAWKRSGTR